MPSFAIGCRNLTVQQLIPVNFIYPANLICAQKEHACSIVSIFLIVQTLFFTSS
jgi:hypothetical protein